MKKIVLFLFLLIFGLVSFSNGQFVSEVNGSDCHTSRCSFDSLSSINFTSFNIKINVYCEDYIDLTFYKSGGPITVDRLKLDCLRNGNPLDLSKGFSISSIYGDNFNDSKVIYSSSKMPVSSLSPVIGGFSSSINEFIPYVVYVGLGVLLVLIGFYSIRWLINWIRKMVFSSFK